MTIPFAGKEPMVWLTHPLKWRPIHLLVPCLYILSPLSQSIWKSVCMSNPPWKPTCRRLSCSSLSVSPFSAWAEFVTIQWLFMNKVYLPTCNRKLIFSLQVNKGNVTCFTAPSSHSLNSERSFLYSQNLNKSSSSSQLFSLRASAVEETNAQTKVSKRSFAAFILSSKITWFHLPLRVLGKF